MASTMVPFLYQTRTIANFHRFICRRNCRNLLPPIQRKKFHTSLSHPLALNDVISDYPNHELDSIPDSDRQSKHWLRSSRRRNSFGVNKGGYEDDVGPRILKHFRSIDIEGNNHDMEGGTTHANTIDFDEKDTDLLRAGTEISALTSPTFPRRESTITDSERHTFQRIFSDILARSQNPTLGTIRDDDTPYIVPVDTNSAKSKLNSILGDAMTSAQPRTLSEKEAAVNRYPPALRAAAAKAIGLHPKESLEETALNKQDMAHDELERIREPERERVEGLLRAAKTDFKLWEILEAEVFPLIHKMGLQDAQLEAQQNEEIRQARKRSQPAKVTTKQKFAGVRKLPLEKDHDKEVKEKATNQIPPLSIYGPLYPSYLLLALRLLIRSFSKPSPLSLSILPRIKSLGLLSHVLGASTPLYNELLRLYWFRYDDVRSCLDMLTEMEEAALEFDAETYEIVRNIVRLRYMMARGDMGPNLKALSGMPEYKKANNFLQWRDRIQKILEEQAST